MSGSFALGYKSLLGSRDSLFTDAIEGGGADSIREMMLLIQFVHKLIHFDTI